MSERYDAIIGGGGPTGLAMALALAHQFAGDARIALVDPSTGAPSTANDPRAWALAAASTHMLQALGVWSDVAPHAQPVSEIEITDSPLQAGIRPVLLSYDNQTDAGMPAAHIVPNQALLDALRAAVQRLGARVVTRLMGRAINTFDTLPSGINATLDDGQKLVADLLIAADGRNSQLRDAAGIKCLSWPYRQLGIVTTVTHERPHNGKAVQHFLPGGPFAILPLPGNRSCITWSEGADAARRIMSLGDADFLAELQRRFGGKLGLLELAGPRASFPLGMQLARSFIAPRLALIGDAAHSVHPIAGQGLNLALRDIAALSECIADGAGAGLSCGDLTVLERYQAWRRFDSTLSAGTFDAINRLFSNDVALLRSAREVGLGLVDRSAPLKRFFVNEAAGLSGEVPRLMRE
ncbi:MAG: FAD-dependent monooxygenase [Hyphomicrobiaceae bacterium]